MADDGSAADFDYFKSAVSAILAVCTFSVNVPLAVFLARSERYRDDVVAMVMLWLSVSDLVVGFVVPAVSSVYAGRRLSSAADVSYPLLFVHGSLLHVCYYCSIWHLALMSALNCYVIVRPLKAADELTDRVRRSLVGDV